MIIRRPIFSYLRTTFVIVCINKRGYGGGGQNDAVTLKSLEKEHLMVFIRKEKFRGIQLTKHAEINSNLNS